VQLHLELDPKEGVAPEIVGEVGADAIDLERLQFVEDIVHAAIDLGAAEPPAEVILDRLQLRRRPLCQTCQYSRRFVKTRREARHYRMPPRLNTFL
jgi:hypothetical protein